MPHDRSCKLQVAEKKKEYIASTLVVVVVVVVVAAAAAAAMDNIHFLVGLAFILDGSTATRAWATDSLLFICQGKERDDKEEK